MSKANELMAQIETAGHEHEALVAAELADAEKALTDLRAGIANSGLLPAVQGVVERHYPCAAVGGGFIPLDGQIENRFAVGLKFSGEYALYHDQHKAVSVREAAEFIVHSVEYRLADAAHLDGCVDRYLDGVLKSVNSRVEWRKARLRPGSDWKTSPLKR